MKLRTVFLGLLIVAITLVYSKDNERYSSVDNERYSSDIVLSRDRRAAQIATATISLVIGTIGLIFGTANAGMGSYNTYQGEMTRDISAERHDAVNIKRNYSNKTLFKS